MDKPFAYGHAEFEAVRSKIRQLTGINLADSKDSMVYSRLSRRLRALGFQSFRQYLAFLDSDKDETEHFINALTTNLTSFFREAHHFDALADYLDSHPGPLTIWSAACSSGEEAYSIAMTCAEARGCLTTNVRILASDIDSKMLEKAKLGIYPLAAVEKLSEVRRKQFFHRGKGTYAGLARVVPAMKNAIEFFQQNLLHAPYDVESGIDIVFCRNVMIYFDRPTQEQILTRILALLRPNGLYFAGHSENFAHLSTLMRPLGKTIYQVR